MSSTAQQPLACVPALEVDCAYLLLGDLWGLLEEPEDLITSRWLVSVLDWLLLHRVRIDAILALRGLAADTWTEVETIDQEFYAKLQRMRDRVAHRKPYAILANEIRCDLQLLLTRP